MADDRPADDVVTMVAELKKQLDDLRSTVLVRASRLPTGSIEPTILSVGKPETLFLQGQTVARASYPVLWQWVADNGLSAVSGLFGAGDGSTTFVLPNLQGRMLVGAGTLGTSSYACGAAGGTTSTTLTVTNMPVHNHPPNSSGYTGAVADHGHGTSGTTNSTGQHSGHFPATGATNVANGTSTVYGLAAWNNSGSFNSPHNHTVLDPTYGAGGHNHTIDTTNQNVGGGAAFDTRPPYIAVNWLIWA